jgi:hypothetical protein
MPSNEIEEVLWLGPEWTHSIGPLRTALDRLDERAVMRLAVNDTDFVARLPSTKLVIGDLSGSDATVMRRLGIVQAAGVPVLLIAAGPEHIPTDVSSRVLMYAPDEPARQLAERFGVALQDALARPEAFTFAAAAKEREQQRSVFISYSHHDQRYLDRLLVHLKPLEREGLVDLWVDTRLRPGDRWKDQIEQALNHAAVAILLVSADFLASDFIAGNELPPILRRAAEAGTRVIPIVVKPCRFGRDGSLKHFQAVNDPRKPLIQLSEGEQEAYFDQAAAEVERVLSAR